MLTLGQYYDSKHKNDPINKEVVKAPIDRSLMCEECGKVFVCKEALFAHLDNATCIR